MEIRFKYIHHHVHELVLPDPGRLQDVIDLRQHVLHHDSLLGLALPRGVIHSANMDMRPTANVR